MVTNQPYRSFKYRQNVSKCDLVPRAVFFCRYRSARLNIDAKYNNGERKPPRIGKIEYVTDTEVDNITTRVGQGSYKRSSVSSCALRSRWRGFHDTKLGGSHVDTESNCQKYTFGEPICGAGEVSIGAFNDGLELCWAFDHEKINMQTFRRNFYTTAKTHVEALTIDAREFVEKISSSVCSPTAYRVDFMHMVSPLPAILWQQQACRCLEKSKATARLQQCPRTSVLLQTSHRHPERGGFLAQ